MARPTSIYYVANSLYGIARINPLEIKNVELKTAFSERVEEN